MCHAVPRVLETVKYGKLRAGLVYGRSHPSRPWLATPNRENTRARSPLIAPALDKFSPSQGPGTAPEPLGGLSPGLGDIPECRIDLREGPRRDSRTRIRDSRRRNRRSRKRISYSRSRAAPSLRRNRCSLERHPPSRTPRPASRRPARDSLAARSHSRTASRPSRTRVRDSASTARYSRRPRRTDTKAIPPCPGLPPFKRVTPRLTRTRKSRPKAAQGDNSDGASPRAAAHAGGAAASRRPLAQRADISLRRPSRPWFLPDTLSRP